MSMFFLEKLRRDGGQLQSKFFFCRLLDFLTVKIRSYRMKDVFLKNINFRGSSRPIFPKPHKSHIYKKIAICKVLD